MRKYFNFCYFRGLEEVGAVSKCYLVRGDVIHDIENKPNFGSHWGDTKLDPSATDDMLFSHSLYLKQIPIHITHRYTYGYIAF